MAVNNTNPGEEGMRNSSGPSNSNFDYELLTAYIDNELDTEQKEKVRQAIESDPNIRARYELEKGTKSLLQRRLPNIDTPQYLSKNILDGIHDYGAKVTAGSTASKPDMPHYTNYQKPHSSNRKYVYIFGSLFVVLLFAFITVAFFTGNAISDDKDMIAMSHNIFTKVNKGDIQVQHKTSDPKDLENFFKDKVDFKVFIPNLKMRFLLGGVYNEVNGMKVAHIIHKKDTSIIYTMETCKKTVLDDSNDKLVLTSDIKNEVQNGKNWSPCKKKQEAEKESGIVWFRDSAICVSVAYLNPNDLQAALTNLK